MDVYTLETTSVVSQIFMLLIVDYQKYYDLLLWLVW